MSETHKIASDVDSSATALCESLLTRALRLMAELTSFESLLQAEKKEHKLDLRTFKNLVVSEKKSLERFKLRIPSPPATSTSNGCGKESDADNLQSLYSSNLSFYETVWAIAKQCQGLRGLRKRLHWGRKTGDALKPRREVADWHSTKTAKYSVLVDIIAEDGLEWIKVSTVTENRLLHELAKEGWNMDDSESDSETRSGDGYGNSDNEPGLQLVKAARDLTQATKSFRIRCRHPKVRIILPRLTEGAFDAVDAVIADMRATGAKVECNSHDQAADGLAGMKLGSQGLSNGNSLEASSQLSATFDLMIPSTLPHLTSTLNLDCTILLALISDITHLRKEDLPMTRKGGYHSAITRQIESEVTLPILPNEIYPLLAGRDLVCTTEAARRMRDIVETMGTSTERRRSEIFFATAVSDIGQVAPDAAAFHTSSQLLSDLANCTSHALPDLKLPIQTTRYDADGVLNSSITANRLPKPLTTEVSQAMLLSDINKSVLFYGWDTGIVTVTSNGMVTKEIDRTIGAVLDTAENSESESSLDVNSIVANLSSHQNLGPEVWVCSTARSLIGKDKNRREG